MGARGPRAIPTEIKEATGRRVQPHREQRVLLAARVLEIQPPAWAALTPSQKTIWDHLVGELDQVPGLIQKIDDGALVGGVMALEAMSATKAILDAEGWTIQNTITGGFTQLQAHPAAALYFKAASDYRNWCAEFGLTPSRRTAMGIQALKQRSLAQDMTERLSEPAEAPKKTRKPRKTRQKRLEPVPDAILEPETA